MRLAWTENELRRIGDAEELEIAPVRRGTGRASRPIWVVRYGDDLYVRAAYVEASGWHRIARASGQARISAGGVEKDVTVQDADPGVLDAVDAAYRRGKGKSPGVLMAAFGDRPAEKITTREISTFLRKLDSEGVSPRSVNKNRQVLSAIFGFACRVDTHNLPSIPVAGTAKRREPLAAVLDFYEPEEVERIASAAADGSHRGAQPTNLSA